MRQSCSVAVTVDNPVDCRTDTFMWSIQYIITLTLHHHCQTHSLFHIWINYCMISREAIGSNHYTNLSIPLENRLFSELFSTNITLLRYQHMTPWGCCCWGDEVGTRKSWDLLENRKDHYGMQTPVCIWWGPNDNKRSETSSGDSPWHDVLPWR